MSEMSILETYREKARECVRAADEVHNLSERVELLGLASVYMALADYVDQRTVDRGDQYQDMRKNS
jgi:hypothetical protein